MKILYISNHNPSFVNTNFYREEAIKKLGHQLLFFNDKGFMFPAVLRERLDFLQRFDLKAMNEKIINSINKERPDVCMVVGGHRVFSSTIKKIKDMRVKIVLWTADVPLSFDNILDSAPLYDYIFCSGTEAVEILESKGIKNVTWIPFSCDPRYHHPIELTEKEKQAYQKDCVFIGSYYENRAKILNNIADLNIGVWGPNWNLCDKNSPILKKVIKKPLNFTEWVKIYSAAKIILAIHYNDGVTPCYQASPRLYEAMACKKLVITDSQKDTRILFTDKEHLVIFNDGNDLRDKINYYLNNEVEREKIAIAGYNEVNEKHTYLKRLGKIFKIIESL